jgi:hypothetical protein
MSGSMLKKKSTNVILNIIICNFFLRYINVYFLFLIYNYVYWYDILYFMVFDYIRYSLIDFFFQYNVLNKFLKSSKIENYYT